MEFGGLLIWSVAAAALTNLLVLASVAVVLVRRPSRPIVATPAPRIALVRPFRGLEPEALRKNLSLVHQDYADFEVLFVTEDAADPGVPAARAACEAAPDRARLIFSSHVPAVPSGKVRNMIAAWAATEAPVVAFCDSDILLVPGDLAACGAALAEPGVDGACLFVDFDEPGVLGKLWRLLSVVDGYPLMTAAQATGARVTLQGGLMMFRRAALDAAGGIPQLADTFADDVRAGNLLQAHGSRVRRSDCLLRHASANEPTRKTLQRLHRWAVCFRSEAPLEFSLQMLLNPTVVPAAVALALAGTAQAGAALAVLLGSLAVRLGSACLVERALLRPRGVRVGWNLTLRWLADALQFAMSLAALAWPIVTWRGRSYRVGLDGRIRHRAPEPACGRPDRPHRGDDQRQQEAFGPATPS